MNKMNETGAQDRKRINLDDEDDLCAWAEKFGVRPSDVRQAVAAVGDDASKVKLYLKRRR